MATLNTAIAQQSGARLIDLADALGDPAARERLSVLLERTQSGAFQLVVVGEIKKGKSSFINALLGQPDLLPTLSDVATSTVYKIAWGEQLAYQVHFQPDDPRVPADSAPPPLAIDLADVASYGTEDGNPNNQRKVDFIRVALPHPLLEQGLTIVDTPGLGGLFRSHAEILWRYAPAADAVFFVLDSIEAVASQPEMEALVRLRRMTPLLYFVQTKTDLAAREQWSEWQRRNLEILSDTLGEPAETLHYFPLSAKLKQAADRQAADRRRSQALLRDSGYEALLRFLQQDLMANKDTHLARHLMSAVQVEAEALRQRGAQQLQAFTATTADELDALDRDAQAARDAFGHWKASQYVVLKRDFERRAKHIKRELAHELQNQLDSGATGPIVGPIMADLRAAETTADQLADEVEALRSQVIDRCASEMLVVHQHYQQRMESLLKDTIQRMGSSLQISLETDDPRLPMTREPTDVVVTDHPFETARVMYLSATASSGMAGYALLGYGAVFAPVAAVIAVPAMIAAALAGIILSMDAIEGKRRDKVLAKLQPLLSEQVRVAQRQAVHQSDMLVDSVECAVTDAFNQIVEIRQADLEQQIAQIELSRRQTQKQKAARREILETHLAQLQALIHDTGELQQVSRQATTTAQARIGR